MAKIRGRAQSFVPKEPLEVQIVESYSAADRNDLAGREKDPRAGKQVQGNVLLPLVSMVKCLGAEQWPEGKFIYGRVSVACPVFWF
jgi:hypothetical protein